MIKGAIFDVDGTLLNSMDAWKNVGARYVEGLGYTVADYDDLNRELNNRSIREGAEYLKELFGLMQDPDEIVQGILGIVRDYYFYKAPAKEGVLAVLEHLHEQRIPMIIATSSDKEHIENAFRRLGFMTYFEGILTCGEVGESKSSPKIFLEAAKRIGTKPAETVVFEDMLYTLRTAKNAGFRTVAIADDSSMYDREEIRELADRFIDRWEELDMMDLLMMAAVDSAEMPEDSDEGGKRDLRTALTIAGSDCSGGAGIQADMKTMMANGVYAMSAITALTAQNTTGVAGIMEVTPEFLGMQIDSIFTDIRPDAVKIGMVSSAGLIEMIASKLCEYGAKHIVVDPVMVATSGAKLICDEAIETLVTRLLPLAELVTPNIPEATILAGELLGGRSISSRKDMEEVAAYIGDTYRCAVLLKGGHSLQDANDLLYKDGEMLWFNGRRIDNPNTHGTGCTLSSAIASNLAKGFPLVESVERSKKYISGALADMLDLGKGSGPMNHGFAIDNEFTEYYCDIKQ